MKKTIRWTILFALLLIVGLLFAGQTVMAASGSGTSSSDPRVVDNFNEFKSAMEDWNIKYVKLESSGGCLPDVSSYTAAITVHGPNNLKTLTIEGASDFWCPLNGNYDSLIRIPNNVELTVNGTGTLKYGAGMKNAYNAVIRNDGACKISGVTLTGYNNGNTYGYAVVSNGTLTISSGTFSGITALDGSGPYAAVWIDSGTATISGGLFSSSIYGSVTVNDGTNALAVGKDATCSVSGGKFTSGIRVKGANISTILAPHCRLVNDSNNSVSANQSRYNGSVTVVNDSLIDAVNVRITEPAAGHTPQNAVSSTPNVTVRLTEWQCNGHRLSSTDKFEAGKTYRVHVIVDSDDGYTFATNPKVTFNVSKIGTIFLSGSNYINYYTDFTLPGVSDQEISSVSVTLDAPKIGAAPDYTAIFPSGAPYFSDAYNEGNYRNDIGWWDENAHNQINPDTAVFQAGSQYKVYVYLTAQDGYAFTDSTTATLNGQTAEASVENGQLLVQYSFGAVSVKIGDVNQDGTVDATDRMILSRYLAKWDGYAAKIKSMDAADIDRNGLVEAKDRMILARYLAKWTGYESYFK